MNLILVEVQSCMLACMCSPPVCCIPLYTLFSALIFLFAWASLCHSGHAQRPLLVLAGWRFSFHEAIAKSLHLGWSDNFLFVIQLAECDSCWSGSTKQRCRITVLCSVWCCHRLPTDQGKLPMLSNLSGLTTWSWFIWQIRQKPVYSLSRPLSRVWA